jgi:hypothetical protein
MSIMLHSHSGISEKFLHYFLGASFRAKQSALPTRPKLLFEYLMILCSLNQSHTTLVEIGSVRS